MGNKDTAIKNLEKALESPDIGQRGLSKKTITKEELRAEFNKEMGGELRTIIRQLKRFIKKLDKQGLVSNADIKTLMDMLAQLIGSPEKDKSGNTNINIEKFQPILVKFIDNENDRNTDRI